MTITIPFAILNDSYNINELKKEIDVKLGDVVLSKAVERKDNNSRLFIIIQPIVFNFPMIKANVASTKYRFGDAKNVKVFNDIIGNLKVNLETVKNSTDSLLKRNLLQRLTPLQTFLDKVEIVLDEDINLIASNPELVQGAVINCLNKFIADLEKGKIGGGKLNQVTVVPAEKVNVIHVNSKSSPDYFAKKSDYILVNFTADSYKEKIVKLSQSVSTQDKTSIDPTSPSDTAPSSNLDNDTEVRIAAAKEKYKS